MSTQNQRSGKAVKKSVPPVAVVRMVNGLINILAKLQRRLLPASSMMLQMATDYTIPRALYVVAKLGIADLLTHGPQRPATLAQATHTNPQALYRMLRALASVDVFAETNDGCIALTPLAATLRSDVPGSMRDWVLMNGSDWYWRSWGQLEYSVKTGQPAMDQVFGMPLYTYLEQHPEEADVFDRAMSNSSDMPTAPVVAAYDFRSFSTIVDVGGGNGFLLATILTAHPQLKGILFDLPQVTNRASAVLTAKGVTARCQIVDGDFFENIPASGDAYILKSVIHNWDDDHVIQILKNLRRQIPEHGKLLLVEFVIPPGNDADFGKLMDLTMLTFTTGGYERTEAQFRNLLKTGGFQLSRTIRTASPLNILEAVPAS